MLQVKPGLDEFKTESHFDRIAAILDFWAKSLFESPTATQVLEKTLSRNFLGFSWQPLESKPLRVGLRSLEVRRLSFAQEPALAPSAFIRELQSTLSAFKKVLAAEFQITSVESAATHLSTRIRYELVGTAEKFEREQRTGYWVLDWEGDSLVRWRAEGEIRSRSKEPFFTDITRAAFSKNLSYSSQMIHGADYWRTVLDGACGIDIYGHNGVSVGDLDGSGRDSVYVCQPAGLPNRLYWNRGDGKFEDITESSGVGVLDNTACALFADFDNDGRQDLVVVRANGPLLFLNKGDGRFQLKPSAFRFANPPEGTFTGAAAADYDHDGRLDIYFCLYAYYQGAGQYKYPIPYFAAENGPPNFLMHNNGDGTFRDVTSQCGLDKSNTRYSFCCGWGDYNGDGWPDLYVVNDFGRKNLYRNNGDGTFNDVAHEIGVEDVGAGMSVSWLDGSQDLYIGNMWTAAGERITSYAEFQKDAPEQVREMYRKHAMGNSLFRNRGGIFQNATAQSGTGIGRWAWSSDCWDFDHDGFSDIYIANGMISGPIHEDLNSFFWRQVVAKSPNTAKPDADYEQGWNAINELIRSDYCWSGMERNILYANNRDGTFSDVSGAVGLDFLEDSRAFALADFDGDGRQEILVKNRNAPQLRLMKNVISDLPPAIAFRLCGTKSNRDAIGAAVTMGDQTKILQAGSGFLSQHSKELFFGLGQTKGPVSARIRWPSGLVQNVNDIPANHRVWVIEGEEEVRIERFKPFETVDHELQQTGETLPETVETWLLVPVLAPKAGRSRLVSFTEAKDDEFTAIYNLLFRFLFDRHQDMPIPTSFLLDENGQIVKVYQGHVDPKTVENDLGNIPRTDAERLAKALPFSGVSSTYEYGRNYLSLGSIFFQRGYIETSEGFFQTALKNDPVSAEAYYGLGSVYLKQEKNSDAEKCFESAAKLKPNYPETAPNAWNNLGLLATRAGDTAKAASCFEQALQLDPDHFIALENLGNAYKQQKRWKQARTTLERALSIKPDDAEANYSLGMVFAQIDDTAQAYERLQKALKARPSYPEALNNLGVLYLRTQRRDEAVDSFQKCIRETPDFNQAYLNLARVYAIEGNQEKARTVLRALLARHPDDAPAQQALDQLH